MKPYTDFEETLQALLRLCPYVSGTYKALPSVISDLCGPHKLNAKERQAALRHMDFLLRQQLLKVSHGYLNTSEP